MTRLWQWILALVVLIAVGIAGLYFYLPVKRVDVTSDLIMLGDLNGDRVWNDRDRERLAAVLEQPFRCETALFQLIDVNRNDAVDAEDLEILNRLYGLGDPYAAYEQADDDGAAFPRPREFFRYLPRTEYVSRPVFTLPHEVAESSPLAFLRTFRTSDQSSPYERRLLDEIFDEAQRFSFAWEERAAGLTEIERSYAESKLAVCNVMFDDGRFFDLLLQLIGLDNFLLPGNMEDGTDKSRHWNVFGGIALYKAPEESLILSFKREIMDVRDGAYSVDAVREFIRDTIANINGIYYVMSMDPG